MSVTANNPWHRCPIAHTNGMTVYASLQPVPVRRRHPRSMFVVLPRDFRPAPRWSTVH